VSSGPSARPLGADTVRKLAMVAELYRVLDLLRGAGIEAAAYKGPTLAVEAHGDVAAREYADLDLLVRRPDVGRSVEILSAAGYRPVRPVRETAFDLLLASGSAVELEGPTHLDLHWRFTERGHAIELDLPGIWSRTRPQQVGGRTVTGLGPEDLLLVLAVHGAKHGWVRRAWAADIGGLLRAHPDLDWRATAESAQRSGVARILRLALRLAGEAGNALPAEMAEWLAADAVGARLRPRPGLRFRLEVRERWSDRARILLLSAFYPTADDDLFWRLPTALRWAYPPLRPIRLGLAALRPEAAR